MPPPLWTAAFLCLLMPLLAILPAPAGEKKEAKNDTPKIAYQFSPIMQYSLQLIDSQGTKQKITYQENGASNNLCFVSVDGKSYVFGGTGAPKGGVHGGEWVTKLAPLGKAADGLERLGHKSVWKAGKIEVTQKVEIVRSASGALDACVIGYLVENKDDQPHQVAVRVLVDTFLGDNDGHPFAVAGQEKELITDQADFRGKNVPAVVRALQKPNLKEPGLAASFSLNAGHGLEGPSRFCITRFPPPPHIKDLLAWDIPIRNIKLDATDPGDAAVVMYWNERELKAGADRRVGFAYGGGVVTEKK